MTWFARGLGAARLGQAPGANESAAALRESLVMLFLGLRGYGYDVGWIFGLWLFHFGVCVWKLRFLPRVLDVLLIAACFGCLAVSLTPFLLPSYPNIVNRFANISLTLGEQAAILWLLFMGAKDQPLEAAPGAGVDVRRIPT